MFSLWKWIAAVLLAALLARVDDYVDTSGKGETPAGRAWRLYRSRGRKRKPGAPADASRVVDTTVREAPRDRGPD